MGKICEKIRNFTGREFYWTKIEENLTYDYLHSSEENLWSILYLTGYLTKAQEESQNSLETERTALVIPNLEVKEIYQNTILKWFDVTVSKDGNERNYSRQYGMEMKNHCQLRWQNYSERPSVIMITKKISIMHFTRILQEQDIQLSQIKNMEKEEVM